MQGRGGLETLSLGAGGGFSWEREGRREKADEERRMKTPIQRLPVSVAPLI